MNIIRKFKNIFCVINLFKRNNIYHISHRTVREAVLSQEASSNFIPSFSHTNTRLLILPTSPKLPFEDTGRAMS